MAAACHLLDAGFQVTLVEKRPFLGGRAFSFVDPETSQEVDNGQHVFMGCCTYYINFLKKLGTYQHTHLQPNLSVKVRDPDGPTGRLTSAPLLPAPFHLLPSFLFYPHLGLKDKAKALNALVRIALTNRRKPSLAEESFHQWLRRHGQTQRAMDNFWDLIIRPTLNDDIRNVSAAMGLMVFQEGLVKHRHSANLGFPRIGLSALMGQPAQQYISAKGGRLLLGRTVTGIRVEGDSVREVAMARGEILLGDFYISALPFDALSALLPPEQREGAHFRGLKELSSAPIVDIHIWYDRPVMKGDFEAFINSPLQWVFNKSAIQGTSGAAGQYLCISLSGAWEYIGKPKEELRHTFLQEMARAFPAATEARVERFIVVKEENATHRCLPGTAALRLGTETPIKNLLLAGAWIDTGWPSTMEGAVRSGVKAAQVIVARSNSQGLHPLHSSLSAASKD